MTDNETIPVNWMGYAGPDAHPCIIRSHTDSGAVVEFTRNFAWPSLRGHAAGHRQAFPWAHLTREPESRYYAWQRNADGEELTYPPVDTLRKIKMQYKRFIASGEFKDSREYGWTRQDWIAGHWVNA